jgi:GT2 family glycosyltransferase
VSVLRIAVLLTCHNRRARTLTCLSSLAEQPFTEERILDVVLVDAGSSDGTAEAVSSSFPQVRVLRRGPELFWNSGMRVALADAYQRDPDYYLWLNDDVELDPDAIDALVTCHRELSRDGRGPAIVVGSTRDPTNGHVTYGGVVRPDRWRRMRYELVAPGQGPLRVDTMNGNCVLVPRSVVARIGNLSTAYTHAFGDYDYGHRAGLADCEVWIAPGTVGTCARNPPPKRSPTMTEFHRQLTSPTGKLPPADWVRFTRRWAGPAWPIQALIPYVRRYAHWIAGRG